MMLQLGKVSPQHIEVVKHTGIDAHGYALRQSHPCICRVDWKIISSSLRLVTGLVGRAH
jgi:hypothetical protein